LIEVLVALTIVAVALVACVRAAGQLVSNHAMMTDRAWALVSAQNTVAEIRVQRSYPALGKTSQPCPQGRMVFVCKQEVEATANASFRNVTVRVSRQGDGRGLSQLRALTSASP
jgi:general secretion pathway protein I